MGGSTNSSSSFGNGLGLGQSYDFNRQVENSKSPGNNPGWNNSAAGTLVNGLIGGSGAPDPSGYNAMGDYSGFGGGSDQGGHGK